MVPSGKSNQTLINILLENIVNVLPIVRSVSVLARVGRHLQSLRHAHGCCCGAILVEEFADESSATSDH